MLYDKKISISKSNILSEYLALVHEKDTAKEHFLKVKTKIKRLAENNSEYSNKNSTLFYFSMGSVFFIQEKYKEAIKWYKEAANEGHVESHYLIGTCYNLLGDSSSLVAKWMNRATSLGYVEHRLVTDLQKIAEDFLNTNKVLLDEYIDLKEKLKLAKINYNNYVKLIEPICLKEYKLADLLYERKAYKEAYKWYVKMAEKGNTEAMFDAGVMCFNIPKVKMPDMQIKWYKKAAVFGNAQAQYFYGIYCLDYDGHAKGMFWLEQSANNNYPNAFYELGLIYYNGDYSERVDFNRAMKFFIKAAELGHLQAQFKLADIYEHELHDSASAFYWYHRVVINTSYKTHKHPVDTDKIDTCIRKATDYINKNS